MPPLRSAALVFAVAFAAHVADHARRGIDASPFPVFVIGTVQGGFLALAVWMAWRGARGARIAAVVVGLASVLLVTLGHVLPTHSPQFSDSFVSPPHTNVTWLSWLTAIAEIGAGLAFAAAGLWSTRPPKP